MFDPEAVGRLDSGIGSLIEDYAFLYGWTCLIRPRLVAEVGTNFGVSSIVMARAMKDMGSEGRIYTVDVNERAIEVARKQAAEAGMADVIEFIHGDVHRLPHFNFDLAFIDGDHSYAAAKQDIAALYLRSRIILVHDAFQYPDVRRAAEEFPGQRLFVAPPPGRQLSKGGVVARTSPGWYVIVPGP